MKYFRVKTALRISLHSTADYCLVYFFTYISFLTGLKVMLDKCYHESEVISSCTVTQREFTAWARTASRSRTVPAISRHSYSPLSRCVIMYTLCLDARLFMDSGPHWFSSFNNALISQQTIPCHIQHTYEANNNRLYVLFKQQGWSDYERSLKTAQDSHMLHMWGLKIWPSPHLVSSACLNRGLILYIWTQPVAGRGRGNTEAEESDDRKCVYLRAIILRWMKYSTHVASIQDQVKKCDSPDSYLRWVAARQ